MHLSLGPNDNSFLVNGCQSGDNELEIFELIYQVIPSFFLLLLFILSSEPDSPPVNLTVEDTGPSTATLTWSPPEKPNGVIQLYEVLYENDSHWASMNTSSNRITLTSLRPFSYYNVSVRAYTSYGHGNQTTDTLYLLSGEDGVYPVDTPT